MTTKKPYRTWTTGEKVTETMLNEQIRDNGDAIWVGTTAGDMEYYSAADAKTRVPIGTNGKVWGVSGGIPGWIAQASNPIVQRKGGSATDWNTGGTTNYSPTKPIVQVGTGGPYYTLNVSGSLYYGTGIVTFPQAFSQKPIIYLTIGSSGFVLFSYGVYNITTTSFYFVINCTSNAYTFPVHWMAVGEE